MAGLGHPTIFQGVSRLGSVTARQSSSGRQPNFAALNRGRHLCLAGRPSRWALAHILVLFVLYFAFVLYFVTVCACQIEIRGYLLTYLPVCDQLRTCLRPDGVMEFGFEPVCDQLRAGSSYVEVADLSQTC